ncbi:hypothetical protein ACH41E_30130 [Streptomyces sp. NPDC020412]|uniref:hypothetical protein n=1 Tax=Streptomyces sp. NPDC020412 TaxID=3365073 RepID=UPI003796FDE5
MDTEIVTLAAAGGSMLASAMVGDAWTSIRPRLVSLFRRGDPQGADSVGELEELRSQLPAESGPQLEAEWTARLLRLLASTPEAAGDLRNILGSSTNQANTYGGDHIDTHHNRFDAPVTFKQVNRPDGQM